MKRKKIPALAIALVVTLGLGAWLVPPTAALGWNVWTSGAVGDVTEGTLPFYWTITSSPKPGYENHLWSDWHTVIDSNLNIYDDPNDNHEIRFSTYSSASYMGVIEFVSNAKITETEELTLKGRYGVRYSYSQVKTLGYVQIFDITTQSAHKTIVIQSGTAKDVWKWEYFSYKWTNLNKDHEYVIKLIGNDAWSGQKVEVVWESADVWLHSPYWRRLVHLDHYWRHIGRMHYYLGEWLSDFYFKTTPIHDMCRDHRPYVTEPKPWSPVPVGDPYGWNPCYLHEFRSVPFWALEGDNWYATCLPGSLGYTDSSELEETIDGYEEVEVYTRNPELLEANILYYVIIRYQVWMIGDVTVTLEAELGNEDDNMAPMSPPAYPVAFIDLEDETVYHSQKSWIDYYPAAASFSDGNNTLEQVHLTEHHEFYDIFMGGIYPKYLKVFTRLNIESSADLNAYLAEKRAEVESGENRLKAGVAVPATITFNGLASVDDILDLVERHELEVTHFRFTAQNAQGKTIRGQGTPRGTEVIPLDELRDFIEGYDLLGIQSLDVVVDSGRLESLAAEEMVSVLDFAAFLATISAGIDINAFDEVHWYTEDASWYLNIAYAN